MTLEQEAIRQRGVGTPGRPRRPTGFDRLARFVATLILLAGLSAMYWVPFQLLGSIGAAVVLAALTLIAANLASKVYRVRQRLDDLEGRLVEAPPPPPEAPPPGKP